MLDEPDTKPEENTMCELGQAIHPFEKAGLGKAPFRYAGMIDQNIQYGQAVLATYDNGVVMTTKPGGTCDYCGTYILNMYKIRSADGKVFVVGSDCILKIKDPGITRLLNADVKKTKEARDRARVEHAKGLLADDENRAKLASKPHPYEHMAKRGLSLADYCMWMIANAGKSGKLDAAKIVERELKA